MEGGLGVGGLDDVSTIFIVIFLLCASVEWDDIFSWGFLIILFKCVLVFFSYYVSIWLSDYCDCLLSCGGLCLRFVGVNYCLFGV